MKKRLLPLLIILIISILAFTACGLFAPVEPNEYTLTYEVNGGSEIDSVVVARGGLATRPENPTRGYDEFAGWYKDAEFTTLWDFDKDVVTSNTTLYAKWNDHSHSGGHASCTGGVVCEVCGVTYGDPLGHNFVDDPAVAPTCTTTGLTSGYHCTNCDVRVDQIVIDALGHTAGAAVKENVVDPTCTTAGSYDSVVYCSVCHTHEMSRETVTVGALGHSYGGWIVDVEPTYTSEGSKHCECGTCGDVKTEVIPVLDPGHTHSYTSEVTTPATCTENGVKTYNCACGVSYTEVIPATGHDYGTVVTPPTCTANGYTTYTCDCGHSYVGDATDALGHAWGEWEVTTAPTYDTEGVKVRECSRCHETEEGVVDKLVRTHDMYFIGSMTDNWSLTAALTDAWHLTESSDGTTWTGTLVLTQGASFKLYNNATGFTGEDRYIGIEGQDISLVPGTHVVTYNVATGAITIESDVAEDTVTHEMYLRGSFITDWALSDDYKMTESEDKATWTIEVTFASTTEFKVYNKVNDGWFGTSGNNISVGAGTYVITYHVSDNSITYTKDGEDVPTEPEIAVTLYLVPNANWKSDNARFAVYMWNDAGNAWVSMTDEDGDGVWEAGIYEGYTNIIFCRMNPGTTANNWNNKWNQTSDLTVPTNENNCYTVAEGAWDKGAGEWSKYPAVHEHSYTETVTLAPTCTTAGVKTFTCTCGDSYTEEIDIVADAHAWNDGEVTTEPTCTVAGVKTYTCTHNPEHTKTEELDKLGHTDVADSNNRCDRCGESLCTEHAWVDADCTNPKTCSACGAVDGEALGHSWTPATCETLETCSRCGETRGELADHVWGEWTETKAPNYAEDGEKTRECSVCHETETETIAKLVGTAWYFTGSMNGWGDSTPLVYDKDGNASIEIKLDLNAEFKIAAVKNNWNPQINATKIPANVASYFGSIGDNNFLVKAAGTYKFTVALNGNLTVEVIELDTTAPSDDIYFIGIFNNWDTAALTETWRLTPSEDGKTWVGTLTVTEDMYADWTVAEGGFLSTAFKLYNKNGNAWIGYNGDNNLFLTVGVYEITYVSGASTFTYRDVTPHTHNYSEVVTLAPTCTTTGVKTYTCTCGDTYTEEIPVDPNAHAWNDGEVTTEPTCTVAGVKTFTCTCGDSYTEEVDKLGHTDVADSNNRCDRCGESLCTEHIWVDADCTNPKTCSACGAVDGEALGHSWTPATCETLETCSKCGETRGELADHVLGDWEVYEETDTTIEYRRVCACGEYESKISHKVTLYYYTTEWTNVNLYAWFVDPIVAWPGTPMTAVEGMDGWFTITLVVDSVEGLNIIFNNGAAKTPDLVYAGLNYWVGADAYETLEDAEEAINSIVPPQPVVVYLKPNANWKSDNARFAVYLFGNGDIWVNMTQIGNTGVYTAELPLGYTGLIFCRMNPNNSENAWGSQGSHMWNQTSDLTVPTDSKTLYTVAEGVWDKGAGSWSEYTAHTCEYTGEITTAPTCTTPGVKTFTCTCGDSYTEEIPATDHTDGQWFVDTEATCTTEGTKHQECSVCHETIATDTIDKVAHTEEIIPAVGATCTATGLTEGKKCSVCGETLVAQQTVPTVAHTEEIIPAVGATCTATGLTEGKKCSVCGETLVAQQTVPTVAHTEEIIPAVGATCTATGLTEGKKCSVCGETLVAQQTVPTVAHTEVIIPAVGATCTATGLTEGKKCSVCNEVTVPQSEVPMTSHSYDDKYDETCNYCGFVRDAECAHLNTEVIPGHDSTCTATGLTNGSKCTKCGETVVAQEIIPMKAHTEVIDPAVGATCTASGLTAGSHCDVCGTTIVAQEVVPVAAHTEEVISAVGATCTATGLTEGKKCSVCHIVLLAQEVIPMVEHTAAAAVEKDRHDSTCTVAGYYYNVVYCSVCLTHEISREKVDLPLAAHTPAEATIENNVNPTCKTAGSYDSVVYCSVCETHVISTTHVEVDALGHKVVNHEAQAPTCEEAGWEAYETCERCTEHNTKVEIPATGHDWNDGEVTSHPTINEAGVKTYTCQNDSTHTKTEDINYVVYLEPNSNWKTADARFAIYFFTETTNAWVDMHDEDGDGVYEAEILYGYTKLIFVRMNPNDLVNGWNNGTTITNRVWNQTADLELSESGNCYRLDADTNNWDKGTWYNYPCVHDFTEVTCTSDSVCTLCGKVQTVAPGHTWAEDVWTVVTAPTTDADGIKSRECSACGTVVTEAIPRQTEAKPMLYLTPNSNWKQANARFAIYLMDSNKKTVLWVSMTDADKDGIYEVEIPDGAWKYVIFVRMNPNASANNWNNKWNQTGDLTIPTDGKNHFTVPNGSWDGSTTGWSVKTVTIEHECVYYPATCTEAQKCYKCEATYGEALGHSYTNYVSDENATCTKDGTETAKCDRCDATHTRVVEESALGHTPADAVVENRTESTCTVAGSYDLVVKCSVCGTELNRETVDLPLADHTPAEATIENNVDPTCTEAGSYDSVVKCSVCETHVISTTHVVVDALGHKVVNHEAKAPTCEEAGWEAYETCERCTEHNTKVEIPATGHANTVEYKVIDGALYLVPTCGCESKKVVVDTTVAVSVSNEADLKTVLYAGYSVVLTADINLTENIHLTTAMIVVIDLDGNTITADWTDEDGVVDVLWAQGAGVVVTITGNGTMACGNDGSSTCVVSATDGAKVTIENGTFTAGGSACIYATRGGEIVINGGTFSADELYNGNRYLLDVNEAETLGSIIVYGGSFKNFDPANHTNDGANYTNKVASGYHSIENGEYFVVNPHSYTPVYTAPTCTEAGFTTHTCVCGDVYTTEGEAALGHDYDAVVTAPTCTTVGYTTHTCSRCNDFYVDSEIPVIEHNDSTDDHKCDACGKTISECIDEDPRDHECDICGLCLSDCVDANKNHKCDICNDTMSSCADADKNHFCDWCGVQNSHCININPTEDHKCDWCGAVVDACIDEDPRDHECDVCYTSISDCVDANKNHKCDICNDTMSSCADTDKNHFCDYCGVQNSHCMDLPPYNHICDWCGEKMSECTGSDPVIENNVDPTCTEGGSYDSVVYCSVCGDELSRTRVTVAAKGHVHGEGNRCTVCNASLCEVHNVVIDEAVAATCTSTGLTEGSHCSVCNEIFVAQTVTEMLAHNYAAVVTPATCTTAGYTTHTCSGCGDTYTDSAVDALKHNYAAVVTPATCTTAGYTTHTCSRCDDTYTDSAVDALGHNMITDAAVAPTCTATGLTEGSHCSRCDHKVAQTVVDALGHDYDAVVTAPTCTAEGYTTHTCSVCGDTYTDSTVAALGHDYDAVVTAPTCTAEGYTTYTCSVCGDTYVDDEVDALGHAPAAAVEENRINSTCTVAGSYDLVVYCSACNTELSRETKALELASHTPAAAVEENRINSTCTVEGSYDSVVKCSACGAELSRETKTLDLAAHTPAEAVEENRKESTCTVAGSYDSVVYCSACEKELSRETKTLELAAHAYGEWLVSGENKVRECANCDATETANLKTVYLNPTSQANGTWTSDDAWFAAYFFDSNNNITWVKMTDDNNDGIYECAIPSGFTSVIFCRMDPAKTDLDWASKWNQSVDLTLEVKKDSYKYTLKDWAAAEGKCNFDVVATHDACVYNVAEANCTTAKSCVICNTVKDAALGHDEISHDGKDATCTEAGWKAYVTCSRCDYTTYEALEIVDHVHTKYTSNNDATCTEDGTKTTVCDECGGDSITITDVGSSLGHNYVETVIAPTCTTVGYTTHTCSRCNDSYTTDETPLADHTYDDDNDTDCNVCGFTRELACKHENTTVVHGKAATCTDTGLTDGLVCDKCGEVLTHQTVIPATGHTEETLKAVDSTCTATGLTEGKKCSACGEILVAQQTVAVKAHSYNSVVTDPTCGAQGYTTHTCSGCGDVKVDTYKDPTGAHTGGTATATTQRQCTVCENYYGNYEATIYFKGNANLKTVYCYAFINGENVNNTWPGNKMTATSNNWYTYTVTSENSLSNLNIIFTDNNGKQTADLKYDSSKIYFNSGSWYSSQSSANSASITVYLKPNSNWTQSSARFAIYLCNGSSTAKWVSMTSAGSGVYKCTMSASEYHKNIIFCRMNPSASANNWNNKWNQSGDLDINYIYFGYNLCTINAGQWDCGTNVSWSVK